MCRIDFAILLVGQLKDNRPASVWTQTMSEIIHSVCHCINAGKNYAGLVLFERSVSWVSWVSWGFCLFIPEESIQFYSLWCICPPLGFDWLWPFVMNGSRFYRWLLTSVDSCSWIIFNVVQLRALLRPQVWDGLSWEWLVSIGVSAYTNIYSEPCHNASVPPIVMHIEAGFFSAHVLWPLPLVLEKYREIFSPWNACSNDEIEAWKGYNAETQANNTPHCASNRCFLLRTILTLPKLNM